MDDEKCSISTVETITYCFITNINVLTKMIIQFIIRKLTDEYCSSVWRYSKLEWHLCCTQFHFRTLHQRVLHQQKRCDPESSPSQSIIKTTGDPWYTNNSRQQTNILRNDTYYFHISMQFVITLQSTQS